MKIYNVTWKGYPVKDASNYGELLCDWTAINNFKGRKWKLYF